MEVSDGLDLTRLVASLAREVHPELGCRSCAPTGEEYVTFALRVPIRSAPFDQEIERAFHLLAASFLVQVAQRFGAEASPAYKEPEEPSTVRGACPGTLYWRVHPELRLSRSEEDLRYALRLYCRLLISAKPVQANAEITP